MLINNSHLLLEIIMIRISVDKPCTIKLQTGGARGVMVIVVGNGHSDTSSNPGRDIAFHITLIPLGKVWIQLFSPQLWVNSRAD